jgi:hypothetical protein
MEVAGRLGLALVGAALSNAFRPGAALDEPSLFTGRRDQIIQLGQYLHTRGVCPVIYGPRGLGKSSLALQAQRIAQGDVTLLEDYGAPEWAFGEDNAYLAFYVPCTDAIRDTPSILQRVVNSLSSVEIDEAGEANQLIDRTTMRRITLKFFQSETLRRYKPADKTPAYDSLDVDEKLQAMATRLSDTYGHPVLVIVDELDVVKNTSGLASFIKNASSPDLKFILVGIGQNVSTLLGDHRSIERIVTPVQVPRMEDPDLAQIIDRAMEGLAELGLNYSFNRSSSRLLVRLASGFPWFVHLLGQEALLTAHRSGRTAVTREEVEAAIISLAGNRFAQQFREQYRRAIRDSPTREKVLRAFARYRNQTIPTSEIFPVLRRVGVTTGAAKGCDLSGT